MGLLDLEEKDHPQRLCSEGLLEEYLTYASYQESPMDFHMWVCISMIAIAMGRDCYVNWGAWKVYPNMYVVLVGESAITHKSTAIKMGTKPLKLAVPKLHGLAQKMSPEALIKYMVGLSEDNGEAVAYMNISELSVLLGKQKLDDSLIKLLTDLWDSDDEHTSFTIARGEETIKNICLNMIAGSTPQWLKNSVPLESLEGGFFSRLVLVQRPPTGIKNAMPMMKQKHHDALHKVMVDLKSISNMEGGFTITQAAEKAYINWYHNYNHPEKAESFMRGYFGRKGDFVLKLSMVLSASIDDSMIISEHHVNAAITILNENEEYAKDIVRYMGTTDEGAKTLAVLKKIRDSKVSIRKKDNHTGEVGIKTIVGIEKSKLTRVLAHKYKAMEINEIVDGLIQSGEITLLMSDNRTIYEYKGEGLKDRDN